MAPLNSEEYDVSAVLLEYADDMEPTRGDEEPDEYATCGCGNGNDGNLSFTCDDRWKDCRL